jgi:hypothetical protein
VITIEIYFVLHKKKIWTLMKAKEDAQTSAWTTTSSLSEIETRDFKNTRDDDTSLSELSSTSALFDVKFPKPQSRLRSKPTNREAEALERENQVLEKSRHDIMVLSDAKTHAYEVKIRTLEQTIKELRMDLAVWLIYLGKEGDYCPKRSDHRFSSARGENQSGNW